MPLDKMPDSRAFAPTHSSAVLHIRGKPVACIIDDASSALQYKSLFDDPSLRASLVGFLNKHDDLGLLMGLKLQIQTDSKSFEYIAYPNEEFVDAVIFDESICIINEKMENLFLLKRIVTDQFVKTQSEFEKFSKEM